MEAFKPFFASRTVWGAIIAVLAAAAPMFGYAISETDQAALREILESGFLLISNAVAIIGALIAVWGRIRATRQIGGVVHAPPPSPPGTTAADLNREELARINREIMR